MSHEDPGNVSFGEVGGLSEQIRELREVSCVRKCNKFYMKEKSRS
jgi:ATP-dependent 26S proteasome regulatory subunit